MNTDTPEPLWRSVVGDTEPWRRGRLFLILLGLWTLFSQCVMLGGQILGGRVESVMIAGAGAVLFWVLFYVICIGVHWVRWLIGGVAMLIAFTNLVWGLRDGNSIRIVDGTIGLPVAAYLALAPSVYFFRAPTEGGRALAGVADRRRCVRLAPGELRRRHFRALSI